MKKYLSFLLVICLLMSCFTACDFGGNSEGNDDGDSSGKDKLKVTAKEDVGIPDEWIEAMDDALILLEDSHLSFVQGELCDENGGVPIRMDGKLYLPALFVAESLGAETEVKKDGNELTVQLEETTIELIADAFELIVNGKSQSLDTPVVLENSELMVPATPYCQALGYDMRDEDGLIFISNDLEAAEQGASAQSVGLVHSAVRAQLTPVSGGLFQGEGTYDQRKACSEIVVIDPTLAPWSSPAGELAAVSGCLFIEDLSITMASEDQFDCSMTVYNYLGYTYGSVEVYDSDDNLVELEQITPFEGQKDSITGAFCDIGTLMSDIQKAVTNLDLDHLNYKSSLNSSIQEIKVRVPVGGYVFITCNPEHSQYVALYNAAHALVEVAMSTGDVASLAFGSGDEDTFKDAMKDEIIETLLSKGPKAVEIAEEFCTMLSKTSNCSVAEVGKYVSQMAKSMADMFQRADINVGELLSDAAEEAATTVSDFALEKLLTKFAPFTKSAFDSWNIICNTSNLFCLFQDLQSVSNTRSILLETADWRAAYAKILREHEEGFNLRFVLGYVDGDMIPELMVIDAVAHFGNTLEIFSYRDGEIVKLKDTGGETEMSVQYASFSYVELAGVLSRGGMHMGYVSNQYLMLEGDQFQSKHLFRDNSGTEEEPYFQYNDKDVTEWYYRWKQSELDKEYSPAIVYVDGFSDGYDLTEKNIVAVLEQ